LKNEKVLEILYFETRRLPNHRMVRATVEHIDLLGSFDTGQYGLIQLDDQAAKVLKMSSLMVSAGNDGYDDPIVIARPTITVLNIVFSSNTKRFGIMRKRKSMFSKNDPVVKKEKRCNIWIVSVL
jgi:hypothetical protein